METGQGPTPDLVIAGAARSGTSSLAARLGEHPEIDPSAVKEPNYYSRQYERGPGWYDALFSPRVPGLIRLDASVSYTFPHFPDALARLAADAPHVRLVYAVRDPLDRAMSHYQLHRTYFQMEPAKTFGLALLNNPIYAGTSDYTRWLATIDDHFPRERVLVVPFTALTSADDVAFTAICRQFLGLGSAPVNDKAAAKLHQNQVVTFRSARVRDASQRFRQSRYYPIVRSRLGAHRLRRIRQVLTRQATKPTNEEMLASCTPAQRDELRALAEVADLAVRRRLREQDEQTGLALASYWDGHRDVATPAAPDRGPEPDPHD
jgi:Sulfotransferase domain